MKPVQQSNYILHIIRGLPGSGKSTEAKKMQADLCDVYGISAPPIYEADDFFTDADGNYNFNPNKLHAAHSQCQENVQRAMEEGKPAIIVSNTFTTRKELKPYLQMAQKLGYDVEIKTMFGNYGSIHGVPEETMNRMRARFQVDVVKESENVELKFVYPKSFYSTEGI